MLKSLLGGKTPAFVKLVLVVSMTIFGVAELVPVLNHALQAANIFGGQGAQGQAQMRDPTDSRRAMNAGQPVSGAERTIAVQYEGLAAEARSKTAEADAATQTVRELTDKLARAEATATETLRLLEVQTKTFEAALRAAEGQAKKAEADSMTKTENELVRGEKHGVNTSTESQRLSEVKRMRAEAEIKFQDSTAAEAQALASKQASEIASRVFTDMQRGGGNTPRAMGNMARSILNGKF